jgi:hypothetical protein
MARIYYGRPGLRGTWLIVRDVASAILLSSVMEQISDLGGSLLRKVGEGGRTLPLLGAMVGPALDGTINGLMAMKVGYLAKERCRSFQAWDERTTQGALKRTFRLVADSAGFLMEEMQRTVLGSLSFVRATADAGRGAVHGVGLRTLGLLRGLGRLFTGRSAPMPPSDGEPG